MLKAFEGIGKIMVAGEFTRRRRTKKMFLDAWWILWLFGKKPKG